MSDLKLASEVRKDTGKNEAGRIRRAGNIPGNVIYQGKSVVISFPSAEFLRLTNAGLKTSSVIQLDVHGSDVSGKVLVKEIQREPVTGQILHVDFYRVTPGKKTLITIPIETEGAAKGVKAGGALEQYVNKLRVRATPETFMEVIKIDVTNLGVAESVKLKDLGLPASWEILLEGNPVVVRVARSRTSQEDEAKPGAPGAAPEKK